MTALGPVTGVHVMRASDGVHVAAAPIAGLTSGLVAGLADGLEVSGKPVDGGTGAGRLSGRRVRERVAARLVLRWLLALVAGERAATAVLAARPGGQPYLPERPDLGVSLSHTDMWVGAAVHLDGGAIGVDVQAAEPPSARMVRRCCTPRARLTLARLTPEALALEFAWIWSVQEACVKATGKGIAGLPWTVPVEVGQRTGRWHQLSWSALRGWLPIAVSCAYARPAKEAR